jgi:hypothetical protein
MCYARCVLLRLGHKTLTGDNRVDVVVEGAILA